MFPGFEPNQVAPVWSDVVDLPVGESTTYHYCKQGELLEEGFKNDGVKHPAEARKQDLCIRFWESGWLMQNMIQSLIFTILFDK